MRRRQKGSRGRRHPSPEMSSEGANSKYHDSWKEGDEWLKQMRWVDKSRARSGDWFIRPTEEYFDPYGAYGNHFVLLYSQY